MDFYCYLADNCDPNRERRKAEGISKEEVESMLQRENYLWEIYEDPIGREAKQILHVYQLEDVSDSRIKCGIR